MIPPLLLDLDRLRAVAVEQGCEADTIDALLDLVPVASPRCDAVFAVARKEGGRGVVELAALVGDALVCGSVGYGLPWRIVLPVRGLDGFRHYPREEDGGSLIRLRSGELHHELRVRASDPLAVGLNHLADALVARMIGRTRGEK